MRKRFKELRESDSRLFLRLSVVEDLLDAKFMAHANERTQDVARNGDDLVVFVVVAVHDHDRVVI